MWLRTHHPCGGAPDRAGPNESGDGLTAVAVYLSTAQMIPIERVAATIEALFGIGVSTGRVALALARAKEAVEPLTRDFAPARTTAAAVSSLSRRLAGAGDGRRIQPGPGSCREKHGNDSAVRRAPEDGALPALVAVWRDDETVWFAGGQ